jgi:hypothetical protein
VHNSKSTTQLETSKELWGGGDQSLYPLARTFSDMLSEELFLKVGSRSAIFGNYTSITVEERCVTKDLPLPQRYGILTSDMSESANSIKGKTGVVEKVAALLNKRWENCAGLKVVELEENGRLFTIIRQ